MGKVKVTNAPSDLEERVRAALVAGLLAGADPVAPEGSNGPRGARSGLRRRRRPPLRTVTFDRRQLPDPTREPTIDARRAAAILGISERIVYREIRAGNLPARHFGRRVRIPTAGFLAWLEGHDTQEVT